VCVCVKYSFVPRDGGSESGEGRERTVGHGQRPRLFSAAPSLFRIFLLTSRPPLGGLLPPSLLPSLCLSQKTSRPDPPPHNQASQCASEEGAAAAAAPGRRPAVVEFQSISLLPRREAPTARRSTCCSSPRAATATAARHAGAQTAALSSTGSFSFVCWRCARLGTERWC
jgi:hypothetical protein